MVGLGPAGPSRELKFTLRPLHCGRRGRLPPAPPSQLRVAAGPRSANPSRSSLWGYTSRSVSSFLALWLSAAQIAPQLSRFRLPAARPGGSQRPGAGAGGGWAALPPLAAHWAAHVWVSASRADELSVPLLELRAEERARPAAARRRLPAPLACSDETRNALISPALHAAKDIRTFSLH